MQKAAPIYETMDPADIMARYHSENPAVRTGAINDMLQFLDGYIKSQLRQRASSFLARDYDDLMQQCRVCIIDDMAHYDPSKARPTTYFLRSISHGIAEYLDANYMHATSHFSKMAKDWSRGASRLESRGLPVDDVSVAIAMDIPLEQAQKGKACAQAAQESHYATEADLDLMAPQTVSGPEEIVMNGEKKHLWEEMSRLVDPVSWEMFVRYNGIDGDDTKCSYTQIAHEFGYSIGEVKQRIEKTRRILQRNPELNRYYHKSHDRNMRRLGNISMSFLPSTSDLKGYGMGGASVEACSFSDADDEDGAVTIEFDA